MISFFRNFFQSKIGLPIFIGFLVLVALAFAAADITGTTFGGVSGGDRVAVVGDDRINSSELVSTAESALRTVQQENPTIGMQQFVEEGGLDEVISQLIDRYGIGGYAEKYGLRAGENLVNSEILNIGAFRGPTGEFDQNVYEAALRSQGLNDEILRRDLADGLLAQQLLIPALGSPQMPEKAAKQYAALLLERRQGDIAFIPSFAFAPEGDPTDEQLAAFYSAENSRFVRPERRTIRYALFGAETLDVDVTPTPAEIKAFYDSNAEAFAASEARDISSFLVPTEDAANALVSRVRGGVSLEAAATKAGFSVSSSQGQTKEQVSATLSPAAADNVFAASRGEIADPAQSSLGWYVARVDGIDGTPARSLAQATPEITEQLRLQKRAAALGDLSARVEDEVADGTSLIEVAETYGLEINATPPILADGRVFGSGESLNPALRSTVETAFQMEESEPQLAEIIPGQQFVVFDVSEIALSAAPAIDDIRDQVTNAWRLAEGNKEARKVADRVLEKVRGDSDVTAALSGEEVQLPPVEKIDLERRQLFAQQDRNPPPPLVLMFSMAAGSSKLYEAPNNIGWYVVDLREIVTDDIPEGSPILAQTQQQLAPALTQEYTEQLTRAILAELGVEQNEAAIDAVRRQLVGETN
ncbi:SurA N-terminal domain-containing protein [Erythrobacter crassostreae]|uniref:SurA N-terminal domain-containing protein n=1 Tax=Erythrobacter crassostreae TaxID=2828328 RepID=A0A9X1JLK4_9SPHN|nr:SurA N-terminal domain-containing protein [Erythrobacter crassostrea]MBV7260245.1 SurA N-terminal domain-containing protein [Erythrobacter crassostrea]